MKAIRGLMCFLAGVSMCLIAVWISTARGGDAEGVSSDSNMDQRLVVLASLKTLAVERVQTMSFDERELFTKFLEMRERWARQTVTSVQMNRLLNWSPRKMKCSIVSPRMTLRVGDNIRIAAVLKNLSDQPAAVFPFEIVRITERGDKERDIRTDSFALNERPSLTGNVWLVPAGDEIVVPFDLDAVPAGAYRLNVALSLARFMEDGPKMGYDMSVEVNESFDFTVQQASGNGRRAE